MWYVYVIKSREGKTYPGMTQNLKKRRSTHNSGISYSTKRGSKWELNYSEEFESSKEARNREKYFKNNAGKEWLKRLGDI